MSQWFKSRRQEFIAATLRQFGQIRRADIMQTVEALDAAWKLTAQDRAAVVAEDVRYKDAFVTAFKTAKLALQGEPA